MIKKYIKPTSTVYAVDLTKSLLLNVSGGDPAETPGFNTGLEGDDDDVEGEYSRQDGGGNSIWDNVW